MLIRKNWQTQFAVSRWTREENGYCAVMDPQAASDANGNFISWGYDGDPAWAFRHSDVVSEADVDDVLARVPYDGQGASSPEPGRIYEFGPRGGYSNVVVAECRTEDTGHGSVYVWLVMYED